MFHEFFLNASLPKVMSSFFLTLVPKIKCPQELGDYRPISLIGWLYKLVAKVLASRLGEVMGSIISRNQSAFIKNKQISDGVVIVN